MATAQSDWISLALQEAETEECNHPEVLSAEESDARMAEIFKAWGLEYALSEVGFAY